MKLDTLITKCIRAYPSQYASPTWEVMRLRVLDRLYVHTHAGFRWQDGRLVTIFPEPRLYAARCRPPLPQQTPPAHTPELPDEQLTLYRALPPSLAVLDQFIPADLVPLSPLMLMPDNVEPDYYRGASELCAAIEAYLATISHKTLKFKQQRALLNEVYARHGWEP